MDKVLGVATRDIEPGEDINFEGPDQNVQPVGAPVTCNRCQLSEAEAKAVLNMRLLEKIGKGGGVVKAYWNGKRWEITTVKK